MQAGASRHGFRRARHGCGAHANAIARREGLLGAGDATGPGADGEGLRRRSRRARSRGDCGGVKEPKCNTNKSASCCCLLVKGARQDNRASGNVQFRA